LKEFEAAGFTKNDLIPVSIDLVAANKSPIPIEGTALIRLEGKAQNRMRHSCATMVYISSQAYGFYLSMENMIDWALSPVTSHQLEVTSHQLE